MNLIKYITTAAAGLFCVGLLSIGVYADEPDIIPDITEKTTKQFVEETTVPDVSEASDVTTVSVDIDSIISTDILEDPKTETTLPEENMDGWQLKDNRWFYYNDGVPISGIVEIDGKSYLFAPNGALKTGWQTVNSIRTYFDYKTHQPVYGWISYMGNVYYNDEHYGKLTGMQDIDDNTYIFTDTGIMHTGFIKYQGYIYYCNENGIVIKGDDRYTPIGIAGTSYIISPSGKVHTGWQSINGLRVYFDTETAEPVYGWISYHGKYYYTDAEIGKYTGEHYIYNHPYRFDESGILQTGLQSFADGSTLYYYDDGTWAEGFVTVKNDTYYFNSEGFMLTGWQTVNKNKYYFSENGKMVVGLFTLNGNKYYFNKKGIMQTGFTKINGNTYYFDTNGKMLYRWQTINKNKYYFGSDGKMRTGWQSIDKNKYYFSSDGKMRTGWQTINKNKYYFNTNGIMSVGFLKIGSNTYYFGKDGIMQTGFKIINGKYYNFGANGILKPIKVFVGVGHGGYDPGAVGYIVEKEYTLKTAKIVEEYLKAAGIDYILSRDADIDTTMQSKLELCNNYDPDLIIDIHFNAVGGHGFEIYHSMYGGMSKTLAENINAEVSKIMYSNGCKTFINADGLDRFTIIRETHAPAVLIEGGFVDNWSDAEFIKANYQKLAKAYAEGVLKTILLIFKDS